MTGREDRSARVSFGPLISAVELKYTHRRRSSHCVDLVDAACSSPTIMAYGEGKPGTLGGTLRRQEQFSTGHNLTGFAGHERAKDSGWAPEERRSGT